MDWTVELTRLAVALVAGGLVGLEREISGKPAGFRTHILICVGSALMTIVGLELVVEYTEVQAIVPDPTRVAAGIITGIGFLGAGTIIQQRGSIRGLTTAATIWVLAAIGLAAGAGYLVLTAMGTVMTIGTLWVLERFERWIAPDQQTVEYAVDAGHAEHVLEAVQDLADSLGVYTYGMRIDKEEGQTRLRFTVRAASEVHGEFAEGLSRIEEVRAVDRTRVHQSRAGSAI